MPGSAFLKDAPFNKKDNLKIVLNKRRIIKNKSCSFFAEFNGTLACYGDSDII